MRVQTRPSVLYQRLFAALGDLAEGVGYMLLFIAILFAIVVLLALIVGTKLTRSITSAVDQLYEGDQARQSGRLQPPHQGAVERPTGNPGQLVQLDDHVDRETGSGAEGKAASGRRIGDCAGSAGAALSQVDYATGKPRSARVLPSGADGERGLLRFSGVEFRQADAGGGRHQRQGNFSGADDGDDPLGGARVQHRRHSRAARTGGDRRWRGERG